MWKLNFALIFSLFFLRPVFAEERIVGYWDIATVPDSELLLIKTGWGAVNILESALHNHPLGLCRMDEPACYFGLEAAAFVPREKLEETLERGDALQWNRWGYMSASSLDEDSGLKRIYLRGKIAQKLKQTLFQQGFDPEDPVEFETPEVFCGKKRFRLSSRFGPRPYAAKMDFCRFDITEDEILPTPQGAR